MSRAVRTLLLILLIQCGIAAALFWPSQAPAPSQVNPGLAGFAPGAVDELRVGDAPNTEVELRRVGERWILPGLEGLPADPAMVTKLVEGLAATGANWPIARSNAARQRFQVADYHHQRRITLLAEDRPLATIYLGTSPGFRKVHARNSEQDAIYSITFNVFDAPGKASAWIDRRLLQVRTPVSITADTYRVQRRDGEWRSATGGKPDERELLALLATLRSLQVDGVAREEVQDQLATEAARLLLQVESLSGNINLALFELDGEHFISSSEYPFFFRLSAYDFDRLSGIDFALLSGEGAVRESDRAL